MNFVLLQQQSAPSGLESLMGILPFVLIIIIFYFLILRPQQKRQKERAALLETVKRGDKIITAGGVHGTVENIENNVVEVRIAENVKVRLEKSSIATIVGLTDKVPAKK